MTANIRWGIIGTGYIADLFAKGLSVVPDAELHAVASRTQAGAEAFGLQHNVPRRYESYAALAADPDIDVVYISTPHPMHADNALMCLEAGKAVLCEKPFTLNAGEARTVVEAARSRGLFLMEAMWTRYFPVMVRVRELLAAGVIGDVRLLNVDFGFRTTYNPEHRLFNPALGGGALLDVGIYPISFASMVLGKPARMTGLAELGQTGTDDQSAYLFGYDNGALAMLASAVRTDTPHQAVINGTRGRITVQPQFWRPTRLTLEVYDHEKTEIHLPIVGNGYNYQAVEVGRCLREGRLESAIMPLDETLQLMETLDTLRGAWGLRYPQEG